MIHKWFNEMKWAYRWGKDTFWSIFQKKKDVKKLSEKMEQLGGVKSGRVFYIIKREAKVGLFSYVSTTLAQIEYALEQGYIPIVDMKNYANSYIKEDDIGRVNAWELYFEQICNFKLDDVYAHEKYVLSEDSNIFRIPCSDGFYYKKALWYWGCLWQRYVKLNESTQKYVDAECEELFHRDFKGVLGVHVRGTDYNNAKGHPIQPKVDDIIHCVKQYMKTERYKKIYLATEEQKVVQLFKDFFPGIVFVNKSMYYDEFDFSHQWISNASFDREDDRYLQGLEYLSSVVLLSKCAGLVCGLCGGSYAALYFNNGKYKDVSFFDLGTQK